MKKFLASCIVLVGCASDAGHYACLPDNGEAQVLVTSVTGGSTCGATPGLINSNVYQALDYSTQLPLGAKGKVELNGCHLIRDYSDSEGFSFYTSILWSGEDHGVVGRGTAQVIYRSCTQTRTVEITR